jgi:hypothetical protein
MAHAGVYWCTPVRVFMLANDFGSKGWELVGTASGGSISSYTLFFKRPQSGS